MLKDVLGVAELQEKAIYGLGYKLMITRSKDEATLQKAMAIISYPLVCTPLYTIYPTRRYFI